MLTDGESLVPEWQCRIASDQEFLSGEEALTDLQKCYVLFQRLFDALHGGYGFRQRLTCFPMSFIPELFWTGRTVAKVAPEVEFFIDLADVLMPSTTTEQGG